MDFLAPLLAIAVCGAILFQFGLWSAIAVGRIVHDRRQFELNLSVLRRQLDILEREPRSSEAAWSGFRKFKVLRVVPETDDCVSVELVPEDNKPLPFFRPGQHLTLRFSILGHNKPIVRCYSLSDAPSEARYRITVKAILGDSDREGRAPGLVSNYICRHLVAGERVDVKPPGGSFVLNINDRRPVILLAGGIGITPMISMINLMVASKIPREVFLFYGLRNGSQHVFKEHLGEIAQRHPNIHVVTCYSHPASDDRADVDYQVHGWVTVDLIRQHVGNNSIPCYLCGPPAFMQSLYSGLRTQGVAESNIHFEAFGPASIRRDPPVEPNSNSSGTQKIQVTFVKSNRSLPWTPNAQSILELAEANEISIDSGCRAGNCGTCQVKLLAGDVSYPEHVEEVECEPECILSCIAVPHSDVRLEG